VQSTTKEIKKGSISGCYPLLLVNPEQDLFASFPILGGQATFQKPGYRFDPVTLSYCLECARGTKGAIAETSTPISLSTFLCQPEKLNSVLLDITSDLNSTIRFKYLVKLLTPIDEGLRRPI
jgi:hypothetical protein